jgi:hypothetical protein
MGLHRDSTQRIQNYFQILPHPKSRDLLVWPAFREDYPADEGTPKAKITPVTCRVSEPIHGPQEDSNYPHRRF